MRAPKAEVFIHLVWTTWDRLPVITPDIEPRLYAALKAEVDGMGCGLLALGGIEDHVHLLVELRPAVAIADLVKQVKGATSHLVTHVLRIGEFFKWQGAYGAFSVGREGVPIVREYILNQRAHHSRGTMRGELEETFTPG